MSHHQALSLNHIRLQRQIICGDTESYTKEKQQLHTVNQGNTLEIHPITGPMVGHQRREPDRKERTLAALFGENKRRATAKHALIEPAQNYAINRTAHKLQISIKHIEKIPYKRYMLRPEIISRLGYLATFVSLWDPKRAQFLCKRIWFKDKA
jgi:hypothetical protein